MITPKQQMVKGEMNKLIKNLQKELDLFTLRELSDNAKDVREVLTQAATAVKNIRDRSRGLPTARQPPTNQQNVQAYSMCSSSYMPFDCPPLGALGYTTAPAMSANPGISNATIGNAAIFNFGRPDQPVASTSSSEQNLSGNQRQSSHRREQAHPPSSSSGSLIASNSQLNPNSNPFIPSQYLNCMIQQPFTTKVISPAIASNAIEETYQFEPGWAMSEPYDHQTTMQQQLQQFVGAPSHAATSSGKSQAAEENQSSMSKQSVSGLPVYPMAPTVASDTMAAFGDTTAAAMSANRNEQQLYEKATLYGSRLEQPFTDQVASTSGIQKSSQQNQITDERATLIMPNPFQSSEQSQPKAGDDEEYALCSCGEIWEPDHAC